MGHFAFFGDSLFFSEKPTHADAFYRVKSCFIGLLVDFTS
jgi:hypothetical protein